VIRFRSESVVHMRFRWVKLSILVIGLLFALGTSYAVASTASSTLPIASFQQTTAANFPFWPMPPGGKTAANFPFWPMPPGGKTAANFPFWPMPPGIS
jgi:hypothetical protein